MYLCKIFIVWMKMNCMNIFFKLCSLISALHLLISSFFNMKKGKPVLEVKITNQKPILYNQVCVLYFFHKKPVKTRNIVNLDIYLIDLTAGYGLALTDKIHLSHRNQSNLGDNFSIKHFMIIIQHKNVLPLSQA